MNIIGVFTSEARKTTTAFWVRQTVVRCDDTQSETTDR